MPRGRYFLSHSIGLRPKAADAALEAGYAAPWNAADGKTWDRWFSALNAFRDNLSPLIGAKPGEICPQTNISGALTKIVFALPERARRKKVVLSEDDFPTVGFVLAQLRRLGYELVFLPGGPRLADPAAWSPAFHDDVQLVLATHVFSNSGVKAPVAEIAARARQRGVFSIVDVGQSAGAVPVDLKGWGADFAVGTSVKYLCGGPGAAFLWAEKETAGRVLPLDVGWFSHAAPFEFDIHEFRYAEGADRFMGGTPSVAPFAAASAGSRVLVEAGIGAVFEHTQRLMDRLIAGLPQGALVSHGKAGERGAAALIAVNDVAAASNALFGAGFIHDERAGAVRVSVHLYNTDDDVDALLAALEPWS